MIDMKFTSIEYFQYPRYYSNTACQSFRLVTVLYDKRDKIASFYNGSNLYNKNIELYCPLRKSIIILIQLIENALIYSYELCVAFSNEIPN
mgnify:CR=1 FL=1